MADEPNREDLEEKTDKIFQELDVNCDDKLSLEEFMNGMKKDSHIVNMFDNWSE
jgi:Ca2+-binding EF-hand superfamily protein